MREKPISPEPPSTESIIRVLSPENKAHREMARAADLASLEAYNPESHLLDPELAHEAMTEAQLTRFIRGDRNHAARFFVVDPERFRDYVNVEVFERALVENPALEGMRKLGVIGFTFLYNDAKNDEDFRRRANTVRERENLPGNHSVWEMNFWYVPGTESVDVERETRVTLAEFATTRGRETTTVMFPDAGDVKEAYERVIMKKTTLRELTQPLHFPTAEAAFQDTFVLQHLGFHGVGRVLFDDSKRVLDFAYAKTISPNPKV